jgi:hypothetical protein
MEAMFCLKYYSLELKCIGERNILVIDKLCFVIVKKTCGNVRSFGGC